MPQADDSASSSLHSRVSRQTVDLRAYPDLVVIYLGMRINAWAGLKTVAGFGPKINESVEAKPEGLLHHERVIYSLFPPNVGMRQYWRSFEDLEAWTRSEPHRAWWKAFLKNSGGTGFWHEAYFMRGGMEAIYDDVKAPVGFGRFAPVQPAVGSAFSARRRLGRAGPEVGPPPVGENEVQAP
jgi:hypothetical protein